MSLLSLLLRRFSNPSVHLTCTILLLMCTEASFGQDSIIASATYREHDVMRSGVMSSEDGSSKAMTRARVQSELRQIPTPDPVTFTDSSKLDVGERIVEGYNKSTVIIDRNGSGRVTILACEYHDTTNVYTTERIRSAVLHVPFEIDAKNGTVDSKADHDPSLTVTERRAVAASPAVTILRFEQYLKHAQQRNSVLRDLIEKSLDYYLPSVWIKEASLLTDSTWDEGGVAPRISEYLAIGEYESSGIKIRHTIRIALYIEDGSIRRIKYAISKDIESPEPSKALNPQIAFSGEGVAVLEIVRE